MSLTDDMKKTFEKIDAKLAEIIRAGDKVRVSEDNYYDLEMQPLPPMEMTQDIFLKAEQSKMYPDEYLTHLRQEAAKKNQEAAGKKLDKAMKAGEETLSEVRDSFQPLMLELNKHQESVRQQIRIITDKLLELNKSDKETKTEEKAILLDEAKKLSLQSLMIIHYKEMVRVINESTNLDIFIKSMEYFTKFINRCDKQLDKMEDTNEFKNIEQVSMFLKQHRQNADVIKALIYCQPTLFIFDVIRSMYNQYSANVSRADTRCDSLLSSEREYQRNLEYQRTLYNMTRVPNAANNENENILGTNSNSESNRRWEPYEKTGSPKRPLPSGTRLQDYRRGQPSSKPMSVSERAEQGHNVRQSGIIHRKPPNS